MSCTTHRMPSRSVSVSQPAAAALCGRLVRTRSSEHIFTPARAEYVAFDEHAKTCRHRARAPLFEECKRECGAWREGVPHRHRLKHGAVLVAAACRVAYAGRQVALADLRVFAVGRVADQLAAAAVAGIAGQLGVGVVCGAGRLPSVQQLHGRGPREGRGKHRRCPTSAGRHFRAGGDDLEEATTYVQPFFCIQTRQTMLRGRKQAVSLNLLGLVTREPWRTWSVRLALARPMR